VVYNPYLVVPFATWAIAQVGKFTISAFRGRLDFRYLYASGGMPSVHSAVVCSLATTALLVDGVGSHLFGFVALFAAIVMYDSFGVRRSAGEQAGAINMLVASLDRSRVKLEQPDLHVREILGHQPREVTVGAMLGILLAILFNYDRLGRFGSFLQTLPGRPEILAYLVAFLVVLVGGVLARVILRARYPKSKIMKKVGKQILTATQVTGWLGWVSVVFVYERASYLGWRLWPLVMLLVGLLWAIWLLTASYRTVPAAMAGEANEARKLKWLTWGRSKGPRATKR
jgi:acid phosphatase family membrane protein YuiD